MLFASCTLGYGFLANVGGRFSSLNDNKYI